MKIYVVIDKYRGYVNLLKFGRGLYVMMMLFRNRKNIGQDLGGCWDGCL